MHTQHARKLAVKIVTGCVLYLFALALHGASERPSRLPVEEDWPDLMTEYGRLSKFWAQAASAAPEARAYIEQLRAAGRVTFCAAHGDF